MAKLIGTNPNQVPSNADLGTAAFMDKSEFLLSKGSSISTVNAVIPKTAVDVFIYDTSKDSDGGAWRKRTQHTSWYNERLNTTTRGSRREFPAVAVIVTEATQVTIYDGDDPSLPMWMVFNVAVDNILHGSSNRSAVFAINGVIASGALSNGVVGINLVSDEALYYYYFASRAVFNGSISKRNNTSSWTIISGGAIVANSVNDVAMTVLPNAPIDPATQLPIPTIAVATDGGVSVIKDDGTVVDIVPDNSLYTFIDSIDFTEDQKIIFYNDNEPNYRYLRVYDIPTSDLSISFSNDDGTESEFYYFSGSNKGDLSFPYYSGGGVPPIARRNIGTPNLLVRIDPNLENPSSGLASLIASSYNTGWMNGDIKLAALSDTDDTNVTGTELITNGTFDSGTTGWTIGESGVDFTVSNGVASLAYNGTTPYGNIYQTINTVVGATYVVKIERTNVYTNASARLTVEQGIYGNGSLRLGIGGEGNHTLTFVANSTTTNINIKLESGSRSNSSPLSFDNVSVRLAEEDRSVNGNGLQVFGTVTKTPVATGADLVAYSGFSTSNYLQQPYNSDLDFGTGDFCIMGWVKRSVGAVSERIISRDDSSTNSRFVVDLAGGYYRGFVTNSVGTPTLLTSSVVCNGTWDYVCFMRKSGFMYIYVNGVNSASPLANNDDIVNTDAPLYIGTSGVTGTPLNGSLALWRISATAPTAEQIEKIYNDEKVLFQEGAQATLHGTSDAVTALAYDDDTNLLHVGTSDGRSVFQGLRRVDNTTRAVGTAISAVDGFVVEE